MKVAGTTDPQIPVGTPHGPTVQRMFAGIAHRYDFLNHFLSVFIDKRWRRLAVNKVRELVPDAKFSVDLCTGTGDLALELQRRLGIRVAAADFCHPMLKLAARKIAAAGRSAHIQTVEADALRLPFTDQAFDVVTNAFGLRNLEDTRGGLAEAFRILRPGGAVVILEFSRPVIPVFRDLYNFYVRNILPRLGGAISGQPFAYQYLPESVRKFPPQRELMEMMRSAGFVDVSYRDLMGGAVALHWGKRPVDARSRFGSD
jgi:demethylmenaquinone methyltransferase/2-methoxy-6-polyprenyl-1,4-benzoquinol methylase